MKFHISTVKPLELRTALLAVPVPEFTGRLPRVMTPYNEACGGQLQAAQIDFTGKAGQTFLCYADGPVQRLLFVGLGKPTGVPGDDLRRAAGKAAAVAQKHKCQEMSIVLPGRGSAELNAQVAAEGARLGGYVYNRYQTIDPKPNTLAHVTLVTDGKARPRAQRGSRHGAVTGWGTAAVRDMVNTPAADWTPESFAQAARDLGKECGFAVDVKAESQLRKEKFGGLLAVGGGSANPPRFIRMDYQGGKGKPVVLVGKGITFDTGGISLKPGPDMDQMKGDMAGAGVVLATLAAAARLDLKTNLTGLICTAENMPSGTAYRPGDIVHAYGGKTIEVLNTDAEGRVVLADGLSYARQLDPRAVIDLATLTGAIIIALGHHTAGVMGSHQKLVDALLRSGKATGESLWQMPLTEEHSTLVKSDIADVKNTTGRPAASCTAAAFLKTFTGDDYPWAHIDIAGVDLEFKGTDYVPKGPSGFGVRLLLDFLSRF
jgi:leucyl aminopeptidase